MAQSTLRAPELEQFLVMGVQLTGRILGTGAYGTVEEAAIPGATIAAKKLHPQLINLGSPEHSEQVHKWISDFVQECQFMSRLRHPSIVQFLGICYFEGSRLPALLMEKLQTSLDTLLETTPNTPLDAKVHLLIGTASGVVYLHAHDPPVIHRDLTARNVLIDSGLNAKLADLGVSKIVTIQAGQLAATMTGGPGNNLYMPPEAAPVEGAARYSASIDIFSFGVINLFTLTQTFPKDLKPATYRDPTTRRLVARSEIERREEYVTLMKTDLGETHPLVGLTLDCLEYDQEDRPSAEDVLQRLEEVQRTVPQNCTETKLELIQRIAENQRQLAEKDAQLAEQQTASDRLRAQVDRLQAANDRISAAATLQQQLEGQRQPIDEQSQKLRLQPKEPDVPRPQPQLRAAVVSAQNSTLSVNRLKLNAVMTGREATADLHVYVTSSNQPCIENAAVACELVHVESGRTFAGGVTKKAGNKRTLSFTPTLRGRHELRVCVNGKAVRDSPFTLLVAPDPASLREPTRVISEVRDPYSVTATSKGHIIVSEWGSHQVSIFGSNRRKIRSFGSRGTGNGQFDQPTGVAVDNQGCVFVSDSSNHRIQKFSPDGEFLASAGSKGSGHEQFDDPRGVYYNKTTDMLYVADNGNHRVQVLTSDLTFHSTFGTGDDGELDDPRGVCCDEVGNVYVSDSSNHRVQLFTAEGEFVRTFGSGGSGSGQLNGPLGIAISSGLVYVTEDWGGRVSVFTLTGEFIGSFGEREGQFYWPCGVAITEDSVIVVECNNHRIQIF